MLFLLPLFNGDTYVNDPTYEDIASMYNSLKNEFGSTDPNVLNFVEELKDFN